MVQKVFWENPYLTEMAADVVSVNGECVTLDRTIFFPATGAQESDLGTIGDRPVLEARWDQREIIYVLPKDHGIERGQSVVIQIDGERRRRSMRLLVASRIVFQLLHQLVPEIRTANVRVIGTKARIDFDWNQSAFSFVRPIQLDAQKMIESNQEIVSGFIDAATEKRYLKIREFSQIPCDGVHLRRTGEIGQIQLKHARPEKGKERIEVHVVP